MPEGSDETSKVHQQKLRVVYLPPEGQPLPEEPEQPAAPYTDPVRIYRLSCRLLVNLCL